MDTLLNWVAVNTAMLIGVAAVLCGVALFSLVMTRTIKHRQNTAETPDS
ncbi:MAG: hypothetical protein ACC619_07070 [Paracoccaceae bacterium]